MIDLRRLHVLRAVAHYGTVTAAAGALHMTPSAASQQVRQLGRDLGVVLLEPHGRRVRLTPAARSLLMHADAIEEQWQRAEADLSTSSTDVPCGVLRLCGFPTALSTMIVPAAARLRRAWPALVVEITEAEPNDCFDLLFSGAADLAVVEATSDNPPLTDARFDQRPLLDDPYDLLTAADHPLAGRPAVRLTDLTAESWVIGLPNSGCATRQLTLAACNSAGFTPAMRHQVCSWEVVAMLVSHGLGVALVPQLADLPPHLEVARTPLADPAAPCRRFLTVTRRGGRDHPSVAAALALLDTLAAERGRSVPAVRREAEQAAEDRDRVG